MAPPATTLVAKLPTTVFSTPARDKTRGKKEADYTTTVEKLSDDDGNTSISANGGAGAGKGPNSSYKDGEPMQVINVPVKVLFIKRGFF